MIIYKYLIYAFTLLFINNIAMAQLDLKRDDFTGSINRGWWKWHNDGPSTPLPAVSDGYVLFSLVDPTESAEPFCDAALWDGNPGIGGPYTEVHLIMRVKTMNPHKYGSRGWGLWYTEPFPYLQRQAWFMEVADDPALTNENWWRVETTNGRTEATHHYIELDQEPNLINNEEWHIYEIDRRSGEIIFRVDGELILQVTEDVPQESMAFHIWVDNLVYEHIEPDIINVYRRGWSGKSDLVLDYVQIVTDETLDRSLNPNGIMRLRKVPNEIYSQVQTGIWKDYAFDSPAGRHIVLITARAEQYFDASQQEISGDDDLRFVVDGQDKGWNTSTSFDGDESGTIEKTLLFDQPMNLGAKSVEVHAETSPLLHDVTVLASENGGIVFDQVYQEIRIENGDSLWKEISFYTEGGQVAFYISGTADEDPSPSGYGYQYSDFDDSADDDLRIQIDSKNYGYKTEQSFYGNRIFGEPSSVLILEDLTKGQHYLRLYAKNTPTLYRVVVYGENDLTQSDLVEPNSIISNFEISQNFPNPFNGQTSFKVNFSHSAYVKLTIMNSLGEKVRTLLNRKISTGRLNINWDGRNDSGSVLPSGIYFYRFSIDNKLHTINKLVMIK